MLATTAKDMILNKQGQNYSLPLQKILIKPKHFLGAKSTLNLKNSSIAPWAALQKQHFHLAIVS